MPRPSLSRDMDRSTMLPMMRDRKMTNVLTTPWISVSVTMSPLATCVNSWPRTASISVRFIDASSPVLTATSALRRRGPVANAFGCGESKIPTSGMPTPALSASECTVSSSHCSVAVSGWRMMRTPRVRTAIHFEIASEISAPPNPNSAANTSRPSRLPPCWASQASRPVTWATIDSTSTIARFVTTKRNMRFMAVTDRTPLQLNAPRLRRLGCSCVRCRRTAGIQLLARTRLPPGLPCRIKHIPSSRRYDGACSIVVAFLLFFVPVVVVLIFVIVPGLVEVVLLVFFFFLLFLVLGAAGPAFGLGYFLQVELVPGLEVDFLDVAIEVFELDQLGILIHREHAKALVLVDVLVPLADCGLVFSGHRMIP